MGTKSLGLFYLGSTFSNHKLVAAKGESAWQGRAPCDGHLFRFTHSDQALWIWVQQVDLELPNFITYMVTLRFIRTTEPFGFMGFCFGKNPATQK